MRSVDTFTATIYVGFREGRSSDPKPILHDISEAREVAQAYCNDVGLCVTIIPNEYIYTNGGEPGCSVGLINYPRFPSDPVALRLHALTLGELLRLKLGQFKVSVVMPDETVMLGEDAH